jgi:DNA-directed RNA polymerase II subunit RPB9
VRSSNLLYPKEDRETSTLLYICKACHATTEHDSACTYRHQLGATVQETAGVTTDVANDPTVGAALSELPCMCTLCGEALRCKSCGVPAMDDLSTAGSASEDSEDWAGSAASRP